MTRTEAKWTLIGLYVVLAVGAFAIGRDSARELGTQPHYDASAVAQQMRSIVAKAAQVGWRCRNEGKTEDECSRFLERLAEGAKP